MTGLFSWVFGKSRVPSRIEAGAEETLPSFGGVLHVEPPADPDDADVETQYNLGVMYLRGLDVSQDDAEAARWFRSAAERGLGDAQSNLGIMYAEGRGVRRDDSKAVRWYRRAADQGVARAQHNLGVMYDLGRGVPQDYTEAARWYLKAADQEDPKAQFFIGTLYEEGRGVEQDCTRAAMWYARAAEQGLLETQFNLACMYRTGRGVPQDFVLAHMWFSLAAAQGDEDAGTDRDRLGRTMTAEQVAEAQERAREWHPREQPKAERLSTPDAPAGMNGGALSLSIPDAHRRVW